MGLTVNGVDYALDQDSATLVLGSTNQLGRWKAITFLTDTTFESVKSNWSGDDMASITWPAGLTIYGTFTQFKLIGGSLVAYKG